MIFYKSLCIPPNLEIFLTGIYTSWCLCSREILSIHHLLDKINVCWSTGLEENLIVIYLRYAVASVHIFQFILAYVMLAAEIMTIVPILFNKPAAFLNPIIIVSTLRQIYSNFIAVALGALLCYFSGSSFHEFQCFFGRFLVNICVSYYIIYSYEDFREYIRRQSFHVASDGVQVQRNAIPKKHAIFKTNSENSFLSNWNYRPKNKVQIINYNDEPVSNMDVREKILTSNSKIDIKESVDSVVSRSSIPTTATSNVKDIFLFNFINQKTKDKLLTFTIKRN